MGDFRADSWHWNFKWNRRLRYLDTSQLQQLIVLLNWVSLSTHSEDLRLRVAESTGQYTVKSCSTLLDKTEYLGTFTFT
jgi:hypothetical protein